MVSLVCRIEGRTGGDDDEDGGDRIRALGAVARAEWVLVAVSWRESMGLGDRRWLCMHLLS